MTFYFFDNHDKNQKYLKSFLRKKPPSIGWGTPKDDISGADVARVYYEDGDLERIKVYCEKDVVALIQLFLKMQGGHLVDESDIIYS